MAFRVVNIFTKKIITVTKDIKQITIQEEKANPEKVDVIYNGIDTDYYAFNRDNRESVRRKYNIPESAFVVGMLAVLRHEKRHDILINAAKELVQKFDNIHFLIVGGSGKLGNDFENEIHKQLDELDLNQYFTFTGLVIDPRPELSAFDISVLCSDTEGMSNTLLESISLGIPVVATDVGGNKEVINNGENGLLIKPDSPADLSAAISKIYNEPVLHNSLKENARKSAVQTFSIKAMVDNYEALYTSMFS